MRRSRTAAEATRRYAAFTLIEILIVVVIIGILAAIVIPMVSGAARQSAQVVFGSDLRSLVQSAELFRFETGQYPEDSPCSQVPSGFEFYIVWDRRSQHRTVSQDRRQAVLPRDGGLAL